MIMATATIMAMPTATPKPTPSPMRIPMSLAMAQPTQRLPMSRRERPRSGRERDLRCLRDGRLERVVGAEDRRRQRLDRHRRAPRRRPGLRLLNPPTRHEAMEILADILSDFVARDRVVLVGFDFAFGYPAGFARRLRPADGTWRGVWKDIAARIRDGGNNANNRFAVAAAYNETVSGGAFPFWGCPAAAAGTALAKTRPDGYGEESFARVSARRSGGEGTAAGVEARLQRERRRSDPARHRRPAAPAPSPLDRRGRPRLALRNRARRAGATGRRGLAGAVRRNLSIGLSRRPQRRRQGRATDPRNPRSSCPPRRRRRRSLSCSRALQT